MEGLEDGMVSSSDLVGFMRSWLLKELKMEDTDWPFCYLKSILLRGCKKILDEIFFGIF